MAALPYLYGDISREDSEAILQGYTDGDYLVRTRNYDQGEFIACVVYHGKPTHHLIQRTVDGSLIINKKPCGGACTVADLIKFLSQPVQGWPVVLQRGIEKLGYAFGKDLAASGITAHTANNDALSTSTETQRQTKADEDAWQQAQPREAAMIQAVELKCQDEQDRQVREEQARVKVETEQRQQQQQAYIEQQRLAKGEDERPHKEVEITAKQRQPQLQPPQPQKVQQQQSTPSVLYKAQAELVRAERHAAEAEQELYVLSSTQSNPGGEENDGTPWLYPHNATRELAEARITDKPDGAFVVRSRPNVSDEFVMTLKFKGKVTHHLIKIEKEVVLINRKPMFEERNFTSVRQIVDALAQPVAGWPQMLTHPVPRDDASSVSKRTSRAELAAAKAKLDQATGDVLEAQANLQRCHQEQLEAQQAAVLVQQQQQQQQQQHQHEPVLLPQQEQTQVHWQGPSAGHILAARLTSGQDDTFWDLPDGGSKPDLNGLLRHRKSVRKHTQAGAAVYVDGSATVVVSGRTGFASFMNGHYDGQVGITYAGLPTYRHSYSAPQGYGPATGQELYLFFHEEAQSWTISQNLGPKGTVAFADGPFARPDLITSTWKVVSKQGAFQSDPQVKCIAAKTAVSAFRRFLQAKPEINIFRRNLTNSDIADLCAELASPASRMTQLKLYCNGLTESSLRAICESLHMNCTLTHLQLRDNNLDDAAAKHVGEMLRANSTLKMLSLRDNSVRNAGAKHIAEGLRGNTTLAGISLRNNAIDDHGAELLADALKVNNTLQGITLYNNQLKNGKKLKKQIGKHNQICNVEIAPPAL